MFACGSMLSVMVASWDRGQVLKEWGRQKQIYMYTGCLTAVRLPFHENDHDPNRSKNNMITLFCLKTNGQEALYIFFFFEVYVHRHSMIISYGKNIDCHFATCTCHFFCHFLFNHSFLHEHSIDYNIFLL